MISAAGVAGFDSPISLGCSTISGLTCAFNPSTITPGSNTASTLTISATPTPPVNGYRAASIMPGLMGLLPGLGLIGTALTDRKRKLLARKGVLSMRLLGLPLFILLISLFAVGCGGTAGSNTQTPASQVTLTVTGTSGAITQSTPLTVTIN
jgi:hypothetical protein